MFSCVPQASSSSNGVLASYLSGKAATLVNQKTDEEIVEMCVGVLRKLFPEEVSSSFWIVN